MEMIYVLLEILQSIGISLGVGCSTLAIVNFFVAIADGKVDDSERKLMGNVYILLRVAMVVILVTTVCLIPFATAPYLSAFTLSFWTLISVLHINALLMTKHIMPSKFGPAVQASTWYSLGVINALIPLGLTHFSYFEFAVGYLAALALGVSIVNGTMVHLKNKRAV